MARSFSLVTTKNDVATAALSIQANLRLDGQSVVAINLDPTSTAAIGVNETDDWSLSLVYDVPSGGTTAQQIVTDGRPRAAAYSQRFLGGANERSISVTRAVQIGDRFAAFKDFAPDTTITRKNTDSHRELAFVASQIGLSGAVASCARVPIERIDYTRDASFWDVIYPYFAPFDPIILLDPATGALRLYDPTVIHTASPRSDRVLTLADYNLAEWSTDLRAVVSQVRVDYRDFGPEEPDNETSPSSTRTEETQTVEDDGTLTRTWTGYADLYEDDDNPTTVTRSVVCEQGITRADTSGLLSSTVTTMSYRADYTLLTKSVTVTTGTADLPIVGQYEGELERTTETREYEPDTVIPGRYLLKRSTSVTEGLYVFNYSSADPDGTVARTTATPVIEASVAGTVDVNRVSSGLGDGEILVTPNASTSQQFATGRTKTVVETYQRNHANNTVTIMTVRTDSLRGKTDRPTFRTEFGDNTAFPVGRTASIYVDGSETYGERKCAVVNAQLVGPAIGRQIATRILAQSGQPIRSARITLTRPDYRRYRLGWLCELDTDAPYGAAGLYFIKGVTFEAVPPSDSEPPVKQTLELVRYWP